MMENYTEFTEQELITTNILPVVPLRGRVAFPNTNVSFEAGRDMTLKAIERATASDRLIFICTQKDTEKDSITSDDL